MFALVDCNSCYASCEQIFRPDLRGKPVVVLSNNDGCIIARSKEAKAIGIPDLYAFFKLENLLRKNNVAIFSANFSLYGDISWRVMETLRYFSPKTEVYSIDEMFIDLTGDQRELKSLGHEIKKRIYRHVRMPVGVGIAPTKTLSKLANHAAKRISKCENVCVLDEPYKWEWLQKKLPVNKVWGVGSRFARRLNHMGIHTIYDLAKTPPRHIRKHSNVCLERTVEELNGVPCIQLEDAPLPKKQIFITRSFATKATTLEQLHNHISRYASAAAEKLRAQNGKAAAITSFIQTSPFDDDYYGNSLTRSLLYPTDDTRIFIEQAKEMLNQIYKPNRHYQCCGFGIVDILDNRFSQNDLFHPGQSAASEKLMNTIDLINKRYGRDTAIFGAEGVNGKWTMRQDFLSPRYSTSWHDLPKVNCS